MSDNWLILVPVDPHSAPAADAAERARAVLADAVPDADEVTVVTSEQPRLLDAGTNFVAARCPLCGADVTRWWVDAVDRAHRRGLNDLGIVTPCCARASTLNDLDYDWPQAFARLSIEAMNPNVATLDDAVKREVEQALGCRTRVVWQHL